MILFCSFKTIVICGQIYKYLKLKAEGGKLKVKSKDLNSFLP
jgi:hypothetical protein